MSRRGLIAGAALLLAGSLPAAAAEPPPAMPVAGGWSKVGRDDPDLRPVARFVVPRLPRHHPRLLRIAGGERQVVAGTNWRVVLVLTDRSRWRALVWQRLDGTFELARVERLRPDA